VLSPFSRENPDRRIILPVWCAADGIGLQSAILAPWLFGVFITDFAFGTAEAGLLLSIEFAALALVNFLISPFMVEIPRKTLALAGAILVILGNVASATLDIWSSMAAARVLCGIGAGLAMAAGNATAAGAKNSARLYGHKTAMLALYACAMFVIIPPLVEKLGPDYLFLLMAGFNLALFYPLLRLPQHTEQSVTAIGAVDDHSTKALFVAGLLIVIAMLCFFTRDTMVYVFFEQIGVDLDLSRQEIGRLIAISTVIAVFGPITSIWLANRFNTLLPIVVVVVLGGLLAHEVVQTDSQWVYGFLVIWQAFLNLAGLALLMTLASVLDPRGRLTTACGGSILAAYAISPAMAGSLINYGGTLALQLALITLGIVNLGLILAATVLSRRVATSTIANRSPSLSE
jgi:MFS family permease